MDRAQVDRFEEWREEGQVQGLKKLKPVFYYVLQRWTKNGNGHE